MKDQAELKPSVDWLVLIPTSFEADKIQTDFEFPNTRVEVCGFGPVVPAAKSVQLINAHHPKNVILIGIAGSYTRLLEIGSAYCFSSVACDGIGAGEGAAFQSAEAMGWPQGVDHAGNKIGDALSLHSNSDTEHRQLLTVCAAADGNPMVESRRERFPDAMAEDMEGFAVAAACRICDVELTVVRGISNLAGDRDKSNWKIAEALSAASDLVAEIIGTKN